MFSRTLGFRVVSKDKPDCPSIATSSLSLPDDALIEILLRLPPHPACLIRASSVCKHWHSIIVSHQFLCRFQLTHGAPMLGVFTNSTRIPRFLPVGVPSDCAAAAAAFSLPDLHWYVLSCRHSRILLAGAGWVQFLVLNPTNGHRQIIPVPHDLHHSYYHGHVPERNATVLCAAGHEDRGHCHSCPFFILCVFTVTYRYAYAIRYSSETRSWEKMSSSPVPCDVDNRPSVLVRNVLYWPLKSKYILAFDLGACRLYYIECPPETHGVYRRNVHIMKTENGGLGLASMTIFSLRLWAQETDVEGVRGWMLCKVIELDNFLPLDKSILLSSNNHLGGRPPVRILGLMEDDDLAFIWTTTGVFAVQLKSMQFKKVFEADISATVYPYKGFCISDSVGCDLTSEDVGAE
ncbi:hypothetical protein ACP70R_019806 [Stipagrostis hirtigluma subsp. patula]